MSENLGKCPFCGGEAELRIASDTDYPYCVSCKGESKEACGDGDLWFATAQEAIDHWNNRPIEDALRKEIARLQEQMRVMLEVAYREGHKDARYGKSSLEETGDWRKSEAFKAITRQDERPTNFCSTFEVLDSIAEQESNEKL